jgi:hypothetical protein
VTADVAKTPASAHAYGGLAGSGGGGIGDGADSDGHSDSGVGNDDDDADMSDTAAHSLRRATRGGASRGRGTTRGDTRNDAQRSGGDSEQWMGLSSRNVSRGRGDRRGRVHVCGRGRGRGGGLVANHDRGGGSGGGASDSDNFDAKIDDEVDRVGSEARQEGVVVAKTSTEDMIVLSAIALTRESLVNHTEHQKNEHAGPTSKSPLHIALNPI